MMEGKRKVAIMDQLKYTVKIFSYFIEYYQSKTINDKYKHYTMYLLKNK